MDYRQSEQEPVSSYNAPFEPAYRMKFSGPGIASFVLSLLAVIGYIVSLALITSTVLEIMDQPANVIAEDLLQRTGALLGILLFLVSGLLDLIALILGIIGLAVKNRRKVFAILGTIFSALSLLMLIMLFVLGSLTAP
ncbi:hypothetical protein D3C76_162080 [compost metagenome]|uniref:DUF4064 domain-containing protein n=1 Tax=Paenibacillus rhizolycopersici TaxID=2780073 RepID=A0ABS2H8G3_9BACL|nr:MULTISPECIES: hypothetical protein [Paenibacillus]MBM6997707.1 hypothetical protein [Paenibacillus rhizolycopersici]MBW4840245.1 hypothetical protein [Paenibacillaceae bacterium]MUG87415.1 hypothetical protein [Paenibacillus timonensis]GIP47174.1 hypothetical protein J53TS2_07650 [Paenibacillus sp. J53TS2]